MAKNAERKTAKILYVEQGKLQKEIAYLVGVQEKTVSNWVIKYGWKTQRDARMNANGKRIENVKKVISSITEKRLHLIARVKEAEAQGIKELVEQLQKEAVSIDDGISKWNKTLENLDKENRISLSAYIEVMDNIFKALQQYNTKLYMQTLDFQEKHLSMVSEKYE